MNNRKSGILVHPTSFPSKYGIGDMGNFAFDFIDFLKKSNQKYWQVLPLGHTSYGDSPYQSFSTFAGNPYIISPQRLINSGYLTEDEIEPNEFNPRKIDYGRAILYKNKILNQAYNNFKKSGLNKKDFTEFCKKNDFWLKDYALFMALKFHFINIRKEAGKTQEYSAFKTSNENLLSEPEINDYYYGAVWYSWPKDIALRKPSAVEKWQTTLKTDVEKYSFYQYLFFTQWEELKEYANKNDIEIIGDMPIFVAMDSSDVWANPTLFHLTRGGRPNKVAGVPPDYFSETGQLWGNPLYNWANHKKAGYSWWISRIEECLKLVDVLRIDHFRGFESYWEIKFGEPTAVYGKWVKGPGKELFDAIENSLGNLPIIAEDLGIITDEVRELRDECGFPGMKILHFAFDQTPYNEYLPHNFKNTNSILYTGTHDNDTTVGWYNSSSEELKDFFRRYLNSSGNDPAWDLIRLAFASVSDTVIIPIWDLMGLGSDDRMNIPGVSHSNWQFRYTPEMLSKEIEEKLLHFNELFERNL